MMECSWINVIYACKTVEDHMFDPVCGSGNGRGNLRLLIVRLGRAGDLLSRSTVHAGDRDGVDYGGGARHDIGKT